MMKPMHEHPKQGDLFKDSRPWPTHNFLMAKTSEGNGGGIGLLGVVAAKAKLRERDLRAIVYEGHDLSEEQIDALWPQVIEWQIDRARFKALYCRHGDGE